MPPMHRERLRNHWDRWRRAALAALLVTIAMPGLALARESFTATLELEGGTIPGVRRIPVTILLYRTAVLDEVRGLRDVLARGGQSALLAALATREDGQLRLGQLDYPLALIAAEAWEDGSRYLVVTPRQLRLEERDGDLDEPESASAGERPFGIAVFDVDTFGSGDGDVYPGVSLGIDRDGKVTFEASGEAIGRLLDVRRRED